MTRDFEMRKDVYSAVALDGTREDCGYYRALDDNDEDENHCCSNSEYGQGDDEHELGIPLFGAFKNHSLILGLLVGFFVQFSTLGANFLVIALWENDLIHKSKSEIVIISLIWSAFTSFMAILTLAFLRSVITIVFRASVPRDRINREAILEEVVLHLECRFVVGALVGVCLAWTVTDVLLGMNIQIVFSLVTLAVSLLWCKLMMYCFTKDEESLIHHTTMEKRQSPRAVLVMV